LNKENTSKLINTFPKLYSNFHANYPPERKVPFEFQCRDGWFELIWDLSEKLQAEIVAIEAMDCSEIPSVVQVKEKLGTLRLYMSAYTDNMHNAIKEARERSTVTCEVCGSPGTLRGDRWKFTLCDEHKNERIRKGAGW